MISLRNKHVLITGYRGIALAVAHAFARNEAHVTILGRKQKKLDQVKAELETNHPKSTFRVVVGDVRQYSSWERLDKGVDSDITKGRKEESPSPDSGCHKEAAPFDILINAAGISQNSLLLTFPNDAIEETLAINLTGTIWGCKWFGKHVLKNKRKSQSQSGFSPVIINMSSLLANHDGKGAAVYAASKSGVLALTRALAAEYAGFGIRVNAIVPGYINTKMTEDMTDLKRKAIMSKIPTGRFGDAEEVADAALFLARNQYANNCIMNLDGGLIPSISEPIPVNQELNRGRYELVPPARTVVFPILMKRLFNYNTVKHNRP